MSHPASRPIAIVALLSLFGITLLMRAQRDVTATSQEDPPREVKSSQPEALRAEFAFHQPHVGTRNAVSPARLHTAEPSRLNDRVGLLLQREESDPWNQATAGGARLGLAIRTAPEDRSPTHLDLTLSLGPRAGEDGDSGPETDWTVFRHFARFELDLDHDIILPLDRPFRIDARTVCGRYAGTKHLPAPKDDPEFASDLEYWTEEDFREGSFPTIDVPLVLERQDDHSVTLAVLAVEDDRPLAHADIFVESLSPLEIQQGGFCVGSVPDDAQHLDTDEEGMVRIPLATWLPTWAIVRAPGRAPALVLLNDCVRPTTGHQIVRMSLAAKVVGRVHGAACGLYIYATGRYTDIMRTEDANDWLSVVGAANEGTFGAYTQTDTNGDFEFDGLPGGVELEFAVDSFPALRRVLRTTDDSVQRIDWTLPQLGRIIATVRDTDGAPIEGAALTLVSADSLGSYFRGFVDSHELQVKSDRGGRCEWDLVRQGRWAVAYRAAGDSTPWTDAWASVDLVEEGATVSVELILAPGSTIKGRVLDPDGRPIPARISAFQWPHEYDIRSDDGEFEFGPLPVGTYRLSADEEHRDPKDVLLGAWAVAEAGAKDVELRLERGGAIAIELLDPNGIPHTRSLYTWRRTDEPQDSCLGGGSTPRIWLRSRPGIYALFALTDDGRAAFATNLVIKTGQITEMSVPTVEAHNVTVLGVDPLDSVRVRIQGVDFFAPMSGSLLRLPLGTYSVLRTNESSVPAKLIRSTIVTVNASGDEAVADLR